MRIFVNETEPGVYPVEVDGVAGKWRPVETHSGLTRAYYSYIEQANRYPRRKGKTAEEELHLTTWAIYSVSLSTHGPKGEVIRCDRFERGLQFPIKALVRR